MSTNTDKKIALDASTEKPNVTPHYFRVSAIIERTFDKNIIDQNRIIRKISNRSVVRLLAKAIRIDTDVNTKLTLWLKIKLFSTIVRLLHKILSSITNDGS